MFLPSILLPYCQIIGLPIEAAINSPGTLGGGPCLLGCVLFYSQLITVFILQYIGIVIGLTYKGCCIGLPIEVGQ